MMHTIRSEWIKLRTVLVHWVLAVIAVGFPLVISVLAAIFGDWGVEDSLSSDIGSLVVGTAVVTSMLLGAMTAISLTGEYGHNTIRPTFAATPARLRVHTAKLAVACSVVAVLATVAVFASWFAAQVILAARDYTISLGDDEVLVQLISLIVLAVIVSGFGYALGLLIRNSPATVTILLLWPLVIESLFAGLFSVVGWGGVNKYLPYSAAIQATVDDNSADDVLGRPMGLVWFAVVVVVLLAAGSALDGRRDA